MTNLVLELRAGEFMVVNGAPIRFRTKARIELAGHARFLFGKQIMGPDQADSPARRIYFALQTSYIGTDDERPAGLVLARTGITEFQSTTTSALARDILERAWQAAESDDCYRALKLVRRIIRHEDAVMGRVSTIESGGPDESAEPAAPSMQTARGSTLSLTKQAPGSGR